tara:strand:+ start:149 stop:1399 length:1251 start_codon:yes stop_codon:yes gene_type:complete
MNIFLIIIIIALVAEYFLGIVSNVLNLRALKPEPPEQLQDIYEPEQYKKSQQYTRVNTGYDMITGTFNLAVLLTFWFFGGFNEMDVLVRGWELPEIVTGVLYIGILGLLYTAITLPFSAYHTFVIEAEFGFNKTTLATFVMDRLKGLALAVVLGVPIMGAIIGFFEYAGSLAWLYAWVVLTVITVFVQFVAPTWIMPLFNKFTPLEPGELRDAIFDYAGSVDFKIDNIFVVDGSKRSSKANAFFTGFGKNKRIALFDTLVENHTVPELVAVLAHEIGHYKKRHIMQGLVTSIIHTGVIFFLLSIFLESQGLFDAFFIDEKSVYTGLLFFGLLYTPIEVVLSVVMQAISRKHEYEADRWSVQTFRHPGELSEALRKLSKENLSNLAPHPFYVSLNYSHPPLLQRVRGIEEEQARLSD